MSTQYVGEIRLFGFSRVPNGWLRCDGSLQPISQYETLFTLIGTTYGGNGTSTFAMPNLGSRVPVHYGQGPGLSPRVIGQVGGSEAVTLSSNQLPRHDHPMVATTGPVNSTKISQTAEFGKLAGDTMYTSDINDVASATTSPSSTTFAGQSGAHGNLMPTLTVQFCIAFEGIFPSQG
ncbi:MAG: phage tail protein [Phyllobacterium sp.]